MAILETTCHALGRGFRPACSTRPTSTSCAPPPSVVLTDDSPAEAPRLMHGVREGGHVMKVSPGPAPPCACVNPCPGRRVCWAHSGSPRNVMLHPQGRATPAPGPSHLSRAPAMPLDFRTKSPPTHRVAPSPFLQVVLPFQH